MIKELCQWIEDNTSFVIGTTVFAGYAPSDAAYTCSVVRETGGPPKTYSTTRGTRSIQVLSRGDSYFNARADATTIHDLIRSNRGEVTLPVVTSGEEWTIESVTPVDSPYYMGQDARGLHLFTCNYLVRVKEV